jgi:MinD-like ATPase involved in chromosome partitioning or flagellar assembly
VPARRAAPADHGLVDQGPVALDKTDVRRMKVPAESGWRAGLHAVTRVNLGPGQDERYEISLKDRVRRPIRTIFPVAVINLKGGVGKTVATEALGSTLAYVRKGDKVIAVDLDNDSGNLAERHVRETHLSIIDLVSDAAVGRYHDARAHTSSDSYSGLEVLSQPDFAHSARTVDRGDFEKTMAILGDFYSVALLDCGTALKTELMEAVIEESQALIVVTSASIDALHETDNTLEWLRYNGYQKLLENLILVVNHTESGKPNVVVSRVVEQFSRKVPLERIFITPFDRHIHEGREINLKLLSKRSRRRYLEIAAAVSDLFPTTVD